jgi:hypothetical protein
MAVGLGFIRVLFEMSMKLGEVTALSVTIYLPREDDDISLLRMRAAVMRPVDMRKMLAHDSQWVIWVESGGFALRSQEVVWECIFKHTLLARDNFSCLLLELASLLIS